MGEVLSQNEIDSLLQALSTGELDVDEIKENTDRPVKNYDFKRPAKFSKEHLRTLIYENNKQHDFEKECDKNIDANNNTIEVFLMSIDTLNLSDDIEKIIDEIDIITKIKENEPAIDTFKEKEKLNELLNR